MIIVRSFTILLLLSCIAFKLACCFSSSISSLKALPLVGHLEFEDVHPASKDFGNRYQLLPLAVLHPKSVSDIASVIRHIWMMGPHSQLTVAARGRGHSLQGQAQTRHGIVIHMESLQPQKLQVFGVGGGPTPFVDVSGGELWINILHETQKYGLAPKSWTDYLHLTVGGTLSNAGISGQAFRHGPQISNVHQLEVVTGKGEILNCSERQNSDLFHGVLGGLGQFGIITRARIALEPAPTMVKWMRVLYLDFAAFARDQERLISSDDDKFDYIEGFVIINRTGLLDSWRLSFTPEDPVEASQFKSDGRNLYCLEVAKYFKLDEDRKDVMNQMPFSSPCAIGHEITGEVVEHGPLTDHKIIQRFSIGSRVVGAFIMPCGTCSYCAKGHDDLCEDFFAYNRAKGTLYDGETRLFLRHDDSPVYMYAYGAMAHAAEIRHGDSIAVIGIGGVGSSCLQIASTFGASDLIAVDVQDDKLEKAKTLGATSWLEPKDSP
ncbi:hypothetical protein F2Q70_00041296 [Brassica cretica]|uniref:cytokinin dehydrogenase n=1 Tax=Brassica cretica TaxID=69181 RepID=A0A8S9K8U2_BRACR|nr:hypothetical protein F2Q70_00041296 [Brassica cretica]